MDYSRYDVELLLIFNVGEYIKELPSEVKLSVVYPKNNSFRQKLDFGLYYKLNAGAFEKISVRRALKQKHYDTIVSFLEGRAVKAHSYIVTLGDRNISWVHTDMVNNHYTNNISMTSSMEKEAYEMMDEVVFVSNQAMSQFSKLGIQPRSQCVIHNPIDKHLIQRYMNSGKNKRFTIVLCGRLTAVKAYDRMVRVAAKLQEDGFDFEVHFIGDGEERESLEQLACQLHIVDRIKFLGFQNPPYPEMAKADLFVSTSLTEGYPVNICEALCLGLPIVATRCTGTVEILGEKNEYGLITDQTEESIYVKIREMLTDETLRCDYANRALQRAEEFRIDKAMQDIYSVL